MTNKGVSTTTGILVILAVAIVAGALIWWQVSSSDRIAGPAGNVATSTDETTQRQEIAQSAQPEQNVYTNELFGFQVELPKGWRVDEESAEGLVFLSPQAQTTNTNLEEYVESGGLVSGPQPGAGIKFHIHTASLPEGWEREKCEGSVVLNGEEWNKCFYSASGYNVLTYELYANARAYVFWEIIAQDQSASQEIEALLNGFKLLYRVI